MAALRQPSVEVEVADFETGEKITVVSRDGQGLRMAYDVVRTADSQSNRGAVTIHNAAETTRRKIVGRINPSSVLNLQSGQELDSPFAGAGALFGETPAVLAQRYRYAYVTIRAGFDGVLSTVHEGSSSRVRDRNPGGLGWETSLELDDGDAQLSHADIGITFAPGSDVFDAVDELRKRCGLFNGNFSRKTWDATFGGGFEGTQYFATSYTPQGDPAEQLSLLLGAYGIRWWVDQGQFWIIGRDGFLPEPIVELGVPREEPEDSEEGILVNVLHNPRVKPGVRARVNSRRTQDVWFVDAVRFSGDTHGELLCQVSLVPIQRQIGVTVGV